MATDKNKADGVQAAKKGRGPLSPPAVPSTSHLAPPPPLVQVSAPPAETEPLKSEKQATSKVVSNTDMPSVGFRAPDLSVQSYIKADDNLKHLRKKMHDAISTPTRGEVVSTGIAGVDLCLDGGVNFGSIHEFYGFSKAGKTYVMQRTAAVAQSMFPECVVVYFDRENACSAEIMAGVGMYPNRCLLIPPSEIPTPEELWVKLVEIMVSIDAIDAKRAADMLGASLDDVSDADPTAGKGKKGKKEGKDFVGRKTGGTQPHVVFIIDSIPAFAEQVDMIEDQGRRAKKWHAFFRRATTLLNAKTMFMVSNHIIYKPGMYQAGGNESKTSGVAIDYYRDCGVKCMQLHKIYDATNVEIGAMLGIEVDKTRRGGAGGSTFFPVYYNGGAAYWSGILPFAEYIGVAEQSNSSVFTDKKSYGRVWPRYKIALPDGQSITMSEQYSGELQTQCEKHGVYDVIMQVVKEKLGMTKGVV